MVHYNSWSASTLRNYFIEVLLWLVAYWYGFELKMEFKTPLHESWQIVYLRLGNVKVKYSQVQNQNLGFSITFCVNRWAAFSLPMQASRLKVEQVGPREIMRHEEKLAF